MFMSMLKEAHKDLLLAVKFEPSNDEAKKELYKPKQMCNSTCLNDPVGQEEIAADFPVELAATQQTILDSQALKLLKGKTNLV